ncbi:hypothetical protein K7W42_20055 [Deinococcus sp. HMF7604]|uniref:hypothetical protein n=1 Tax=Deinococcus betulae TaxID=2873312 RepID=UPI001CC9235C|nr:hypothetical protein [Deinococcus betulae]MBZ9753135.1 hypothetical protein [Deinococcus betulae]
MTALLRSVALSLTLLVPAAAQGTPPPAGTSTAAERTALIRGRALLTEFYAVRLDGLWNAFSSDVQGQWGSLAAFRAYRQAGVTTYGAERQVVGERTFTNQGETFYVRSATFEKAPQAVWALVVGFTGTRVTTFGIVLEDETSDDPVAGQGYDPL